MPLLIFLSLLCYAIMFPNIALALLLVKQDLRGSVPVY